MLTEAERERRAAVAETSQRSGPTRGAERHEGVERWTARRGLARTVRVAVAVAPIVIGCLVTLVLNPRLPFDRTAPQLLARLATLVVVATTVVYLIERAARRLLPLSTLLNLSLVFPDHAPSRFRLAIRSGSTRRLEERVAAGDRSMNDLAVEALGMVAALNAHDRRTRGHSERVRAYATLIGEELDLEQDDLDKLQWAALLHDIGKLAVPASILNKDGRPTDEEWAVLAKHPGAGVPHMVALEPWLGEWIGSAGEHHERWDGEGYPNGLAGTDISRAGRIVAVADAFEVMTAARSYKQPMSVEAARTEVTNCAGGQFDPEVVRALLNVSLGDLRSVAGPIAGLLQLPLLGNFLGGVSGVVTSGAVASVAVATGIVGSALVLPPPDPSAAQAPAITATTAAPPGTTAGGTRGTSGADGGKGTGGAGSDGGTTTTSGTGAPEGNGGTGGGAAGTTTTSTRPTSTTATTGRSSSTASPPTTGPAPTAPPTTTPTTTTPVPPATVPPVPPVPPTSIPSGQNGTFFLGTSGAGDTSSSATLPLRAAAPTVTSLANYDTDRDSSPGLLLDSSGSGPNGTGQLWSIAPNVGLQLAATARVTVWAAPRNFGNADRSLVATLYDCSSSGGSCQQLAQGRAGVPRTGGFAPVTVTLGPVTRVVGLGRQLVLRLQSEDGPVWLAYATTAFPAALTFN